MDNWYQVRERGAGQLRMEFLWWIYRAFGVRALKVMVGIICAFITMGTRAARRVSRQYKNILNQYQVENHLAPSRFSSAAHIRAFAYSVVDKMSAICDAKTKIKFTVNDDADWQELQNILSAGYGAFFLCSHLGNIEALCAIPNAADKRMHAFMNVGQNPAFRRFIERHAKYQNTIIHSTETIDVAMAGNMYDALKSGELVMMAADRVSPTSPDKVIKSKFLGANCVLPAGVFRFARVCDCPIFAIANINTGGENYRVFVKKITSRNIGKMAIEYLEFLQGILLRYPTQWFNFFDFFKS
ncbi:MAG: hypothetical protein J5613_00710 [Alphaproteobacteria bacterium]|nr:hypothetical protein [Alphaproteobacteria bacterium]